MKVVGPRRRLEQLLRMFGGLELQKQTREGVMKLLRPLHLKAFVSLKYLMYHPQGRRLILEAIENLERERFSPDRKKAKRRKK